MAPATRKALAAWPAVAALAFGVASCGGSGSGTESRRGAAQKRPAPRVGLTATTHHPIADAPWPIVLRAYDPKGRPLRAEVRYQYLFAGRVVAHRSHYRFRGTFHDVFRWPARSVGIPLTFRAVVTTPLGRRNLDYDVQVRE